MEKPPYIISSRILDLLSEVSIRLGEVNAAMLIKQSPELRKKNRIKTIQASLAVEGNTLSPEQVTAILENKRVIGPFKDIREVSNAIRVYENLPRFNAFSQISFLSAHKSLMQGLLRDAGRYRSSNIGVAKGNKLTHLAPPAGNVPHLMKDLFEYLKKPGEPALIKSCVFHYEMEFIHPFADGNGRMGRLWQTLILMKEFPVFEYLPFETLISKNQSQYYKALAISDKQGSSTAFIEFMLKILSKSLDELLKERPGSLSAEDRLNLYLSRNINAFTRKDYLQYFKTISPATASRDLNLAVKKKLVKKTGDKNKTIYRR